MTRVAAFRAGTAVIFASTACVCVQIAWVPAIEGSFAKLPETDAEIGQGRLIWPSAINVRLGERPQLAVAVVAQPADPLGQMSDLQLELHPTSWRIRGVLGFTSMEYAPEFTLPLTQTGAPAAWDAWKAPVLGLMFVASGLAELVLGTLLGSVLTLPAWISAALFRRSPGFGGIFRLCQMAQIAPALWLAAALFLYATRTLSMVALGVAAVLFLGWGIAGVVRGLWALPESAPKKPDPTNPFSRDSGGQ